MATTYYSPHLSGLTMYFQQLAEELAARGHTITVICAQHDKSLPLTETINGVRVMRTPYVFALNKGLLLHRSLFDFYRPIKQADIVHFNLPSTEGVALAALARALRRPVLTTYVCDITLPAFFGSRVLDAVVRFINTSTLRLSTKISSLTTDFAQHSVVLSKFDQSEITGIAPAITHDSDAPVDQALVDSMNKGKLKVGMATRFAADKGIDLVLESIPQIIEACGDVHFYLAGDPEPIGEERYRESLAPRLATHADHVTLLGRLADEQMATFYQQLDLLVIASTNSTEAFGIVQIEAMSEGTPAVVTDLPGVRVPVRETGMGEIAAVGDQRDLATKIAKVLNHRGEYSNADPDRFSLDTAVESYLSLYAATIDAAGRSDSSALPTRPKAQG